MVLDRLEDGVVVDRVVCDADHLNKMLGFEIVEEGYAPPLTGGMRARDEFSVTIVVSVANSSSTANLQ